MEKIPVYLGSKDEGCLYLEKSNTLLIVGCAPAQNAALLLRIDSGPWPFRMRDADEDSTGMPNTFLVELAPGSASSLTQAKQIIADWPEVAFVARALVDSQSGQPPRYSGAIFVKFRTARAEEAATAYLREAGLSDIRTEAFSPNGFSGRAIGSPKAVFDIALTLLNDEEIEYATPDLLWPLSRMQSGRKAHAETLSTPHTLEEWPLSQGERIIDRRQWHLRKTQYAADITIDNSANVVDAHLIATGKGITIAVIDDGFDIDHPEFAGSWGKLVAPQTFAEYDEHAEVRPTSPGHSHGTQVAGVACASGVHGACGVAPDAKLMPLKWGFESDLGGARAFAWAADHGADVIVCSWGIPTGYWSNPHDPDHYVRLPPLASYFREAIHHATTKGRRGLGCAIFFASGNSNSSIDKNAMDNHPAVFSIGACNEHGQRSQYSNFGPRLLAVFPSDDEQPTLPERRQSGQALRTYGIWAPTITRSEFPGAAQRHNGARSQPVTLGTRNGITAAYSSDFGGTSSAAPGAAGVAALVLSIANELTLKDLRRILAAACDRIDAPGNATDGVTYNATGHSPYYGYGRINARRAVELAQTWQSRT